GGIGPGKAERETACATEACFRPASCPAGKTALRIIACNGRNHAPQRRDVDAAHVRFLSNCSLFVPVLNRAGEESRERSADGNPCRTCFGVIYESYMICIWTA